MSQSVLPVLPSAPRAAQRPHVVSSPNGDRVDPYYWLRDDERTDPDVITAIAAENQWFEQHAARYAPQRDTLFAEMKARIQQDDSTVPYRSHGFLYYTRYEEGSEYPIYARRRDAAAATEEILLDVNVLSAGHAFYEAHPAAISRSQRWLVYAEDLTGRRQYTLRIRDLSGASNLPVTIEGCSGSAVWAADETTLFYIKNDPDTLRAYRVMRHRLGTDSATDEIVYEEADESFNAGVGETGSEKFICIYLSSTVSDEQHVLSADTPNEPFVVMAARERDFLYEADHIGDRWVIRTDWDAPNYRLMQVAEGTRAGRNQWVDLVPHDAGVFINGFALFDQYLVIDERSAGLRRLRVQPWSDGKLSGSASYVESDEPAYTASLSINAEQNTNILRYGYSSLTTPATTYSLNMDTKERVILKRQAVLGDFSVDDYVTERVWVDTPDGARVPVSLVSRRKTPKDGTAPMLQYGYGSYGYAIDPVFKASVLSLLDRGFVYAIAHIRGGEEMGRAWYEDGKKLNKRNTFEDFIAVTEALIAQGYAARDKVFAQGGSAGGLLMGAIANMRGDLYRGLLADVPFVDVVTTMLDESIPLTTFEFDEWGNPAERTFYDYMLSYSPYDNVTEQPYPAMMVTTGFFDSQVQYFEPAKWVARLRERKTDDRTLVFKTNMEAGHGGKSGRFARLGEVADQFAFMFDELGMDFARPT